MTVFSRRLGFFSVWQEEFINTRDGFSLRSPQDRMQQEQCCVTRPVPDPCSWRKRNAYILDIFDIYLLTAIGLSPGGSSTVHICTQTVHRTTQNKQYIEQHNNLEECGPCPVLASYTLAFALRMRKRHGKLSVKVAEECQLA